MYKLIDEKSVLRTVDNAVIPLDENNSDYTQYLVWVAEGNIAEIVEGVPVQEAPSNLNI
jgi:hypothetical protein